MDNKINILAGTLEQMLANAEDNGRDGIQPMLTPDDVALIIKALNNYEALCMTRTEGTDIYETECKDCIHAPICEYCADHLENFSLPHEAEACAMYCNSLDAPVPDLKEVCVERQIASPFVDTIEGMLSTDYKERFKAEYIQTKIRYERLKAFNAKIEAANRVNGWHSCHQSTVKMPKHDCPDDILEQQQHIMGQYLHILEVRAVIEGVDLGGC